MATDVLAQKIDQRLTRWFETSAQVLLFLFIVAILLTILAGSLYTLYDLRLIVTEGFHHAFKPLLIDMLTVLAVIEILRTALAYFTERRVKVTYIIDTVMVTVLTEAMAFWHREMNWEQVAMLISLILALAVTRVIAVRFSPRRLQQEL
ncbi:MAG: phosphate-starvation-inducible PsiE family protein [Desulfuromonadales bacterium]